MGVAVARQRDRDLLSPQARPSAAAGAAALRARSRSPTSASRTRCCEQIAPQHLRQCAGALGATVSGAAAGRPQIRARPCRGGVGRRCRTPARRGLRRAARCGPGRASSPSPARATRWPSMPRQASRSWCGRSTARTSSGAMLADPRLNAVVLGPGGGVGPAMREMVLAALDGRARGGARRRCADELRRRRRRRCFPRSRPAARADGADAARRRVRALVQADGRKPLK